MKRARKQKELTVIGYSNSVGQGLLDRIREDVERIYRQGYRNHWSVSVGDAHFTIFSKNAGETVATDSTAPQEIAANPQSEQDLRDMLKRIVSYSYEPAMDDAHFRRFARENAQYALGQKEIVDNLQTKPIPVQPEKGTPSLESILQFVLEIASFLSATESSITISPDHNYHVLGLLKWRKLEAECLLRYGVYVYYGSSILENRSVTLGELALTVHIELENSGIGR